MYTSNSAFLSPGVAEVAKKYRLTLSFLFRVPVHNRKQIQPKPQNSIFDSIDCHKVKLLALKADCTVLNNMNCFLGSERGKKGRALPLKYLRMSA